MRNRFKQIGEYGDFESPYTALAIMIFAQAAADINILDGRDRARVYGNWVNKWEIVHFLRGKWAGFLASALGITDEELKSLENKAKGSL